MTPSELSGMAESAASASASAPAAGPSWSEQDTVLREMWMRNQTPAAIAEALGRSVSAIMTRAARLGLPRRFAPGRKPGVSPQNTVARRAPQLPDGTTATGALMPATNTTPRVCLMCLKKFQSLGRHNRICSTCKNSSEYVSSSTLPELVLPLE